MGARRLAVPRPYGLMPARVRKRGDGVAPPGEAARVRSYGPGRPA